MQRKKMFTLNLSGIAPDLSFLIFSAIFLVGIILGCLLVGRFDSVLNDATDKFNSFFDIRHNDGFLNIFKNSVMTVLPYYIFIFLCGTSVIGCVITPLILLIYGFSYGGFAGYLYFTYKLDGIMFNVLVLIPSVLISVVGMLLLTREAFSFSKLLSGICIKSNKPVNIYTNFKHYSVKSLIFLIFTAVSVIFDIGMSLLFIDFFEF